MTEMKNYMDEMNEMDEELLEAADLSYCEDPSAGNVDGVRMMLREIGRYPRASRERELELVRLAQDGSQSAKNELVNANLRLVVYVATSYQNRGLELLDLFQEGTLGLMHAVDKFDPDSGNAFSTYATFWIRQALSRALAEKSRQIRLPVHVDTEVKKLSRLRRTMAEELKRDPTVEELAQAMGVKPRKIIRLSYTGLDPLSLEGPVAQDSETPLGAMLEDEQNCDPETAVLRRDTQTSVRKLLESLDPREAQILAMRYGLTTGHAETLEYVGERLGLTRERVRQLEARAKSRLRTNPLALELMGRAG